MGKNKAIRFYINWPGIKLGTIKSFQRGREALALWIWPINHALILRLRDLEKRRSSEYEPKWKRSES